MLPRGPYGNDHGDWWFPTAQWSWNEAQSEAAWMARDSDGVTCYQGQGVAHLCEDYGDVGECDDPLHRRHAYHFLTVDPWEAKAAKEARHGSINPSA